MDFYGKMRSNKNKGGRKMNSQDDDIQRYVQPISFKDGTIRVGKYDEWLQDKPKQEGNSPPDRFSKLNLDRGGGYVLGDTKSNEEILRFANETNLAYSPANSYGTLPLSEMIYREAALSEEQKYAYDHEVGRGYAKAIEMLVKDKIRENTVTSNSMTNAGILRGKKFADGTECYHKVADSRIVEGKKWIIDGTEFFRLKIQNLRSFNVQWTPLLSMDDLDHDRKIEILLSKYFCPSESRAYHIHTLKDIRSQIFEFLNSLPEEELVNEVGWKMTDHYTYLDGDGYPLQDAPIALLRKPGTRGEDDINSIVSEICYQMQRIDFQNRIRLMIAYGVTSWLSSVCTKAQVTLPNMIITGEEAVCRAYAESCLKVYCRESGTDILDLIDVTEPWLAKYIEILRDDVLVLDCFETSKKLKLLKILISGRTVQNRRVKVPVVILQRFPSDEMEYTDFISVDLLGFKRSESLDDNLAKLKGVLLKTIESRKNENLSFLDKGFSYEVTMASTLKFVRVLLLEAGCNPVLSERFIDELEKGISVLINQTRDNKELSLYVVKQRFQKLLDQGDIRMINYTQITVECDEEDAIWLRNDTAYIPSKYFNYTILPLVGLKPKEFKDIRGQLIANGILRVYNSQGEFTKRITLPSDHRVHVYDFEKSFITD